MQKFVKILLLILVNFVAIFMPTMAFAQGEQYQNKPNIRSEYSSQWNFDSVQLNGNQKEIEHFESQFKNYFFKWEGSDSVLDIFYMIAYNIKTFFLYAALIFLIIWVLKLLFSEASDNDVTQWKNNIIWTSVGILFLQIAFPLWELFLKSHQSATGILESWLWWNIWHSVVVPLIKLMQYLAAFVFLLMMFYAFYVIVMNSGDEEMLNKWKRTFGYGLVGFILIQLPVKVVSLVYAGVPDCSRAISVFQFSAERCGGIEQELNKEGIISYVAKFFMYFNGFLTLICVVLVIYAGFLYLTSQWEEEKTKKAKRVMLYMLIGFLILVASHSIFRFFILPSLS